MSSSSFRRPDQQLKTPELKTLIRETADPDSKTAKFQENPTENKTFSGKDSERSIEKGHGDEEGEEEEGECGFCLYMKDGGCKETFIEWEKCVDEAEKKNDDIAEKCFQTTSALKKCMEAHSDYYSPILEAEKAEKRFEEEKERLNKFDQGGGDEELRKKEKEEALGGSDPKK